MKDKPNQANSYYTTPVVDLWAVSPTNIAVIGMGVGTIASYVKPRQHIDFYEINPKVVDLAKERFSYLKQCGENCSIIMGDGRLELAKQAKQYDLIIIDAFNSDSIPTHLITKDAMALYLNKLQPMGRIAYHVSNRFFELSPIIKRQTQEFSGKNAYLGNFAANAEKKGSMSIWVAVGNDKTLTLLPETWEVIADNDTKIWTDKYSNILSAFAF